MVSRGGGGFERENEMSLIETEAVTVIQTLDYGRQGTACEPERKILVSHLRLNRKEDVTMLLEARMTVSIITNGKTFVLTRMCTSDIYLNEKLGNITSNKMYDVFCCWR